MNTNETVYLVYKLSFSEKYGRLLTVYYLLTKTWLNFFFLQKKKNSNLKNAQVDHYRY